MSSNEQVRVRQRPARALDVESHEGTVLVKRTVYGETTETEQKVRVPIFATQPARVRVLGSVTRNLGNYNSAKVEVMIDLPCYPEATEIDRTYNYISGLLDKYIPQELDKAAESPTT